MTNFIDNNTSLPGTKVNAGTIVGPANQNLSATEFNTITQALLDTRTVIERQVSIMSYGADPTGINDNSAAFTAALAALGSGGVLHLPSVGPGAATYRLSTNLTIPAGTALAFDHSAISIDNGVTLTIAGSIDAPQLQIFITAASPSATPVKFTGGQAQINVLWWGADPTNTNDSTQAIRNACNSQALDYEVTPDNQFVFSPPELWFPQGSYMIATTGGIPTSGTLRGTNAILYASTAGSGSTCVRIRCGGRLHFCWPGGCVFFDRQHLRQRRFLSARLPSGELHADHRHRYQCKFGRGVRQEFLGRCRRINYFLRRRRIWREPFRGRHELRPRDRWWAVGRRRGVCCSFRVFY